MGALESARLTGEGNFVEEHRAHRKCILRHEDRGNTIAERKSGHSALGRAMQAGENYNGRCMQTMADESLTKRRDRWKQ